MHTYTHTYIHRHFEEMIISKESELLAGDAEELAYIHTSIHTYIQTYTINIYIHTYIHT